MDITETKQFKPQDDKNLITVNNSINKEIQLLDFIELAYKELSIFANPINPNGFVKDWATWLIDKWPKNKYKTYRDFMQSEQENIFKYQLACNISSMFEKLTILKFNNLVKQHNIIIPKQYKCYVSLVNNKLKGRDFESHSWFDILDLWDEHKNRVLIEHESLFNACNALVDNFTAYGSTVFPDILSKFGFIPHEIELDCNYKQDPKDWFSDLTLNEIQKCSINS